MATIIKGNQDLINQLKDLDKPRKTIYCCGCKKKVIAKLVKGSVIYPHRNDLYDLNFYQCQCGLYVGCHKNSGDRDPKPLGNIPTYELKRWRQKIHQTIDPIWKNRNVSRSELYEMISEELGYTFHTANIMSNEEAEKNFRIILKIKEIFKSK